MSPTGIVAVISAVAAWLAFSVSCLQMRGILGQLRKGNPQFVQPGRFGQHAIHAVRYVVLIGQALTPSGEQNDGRRSRSGPYGGYHFAAIHVRHSQVGDHDSEWLIALLRCDECIDTGLTSVSGGDPMTIALQRGSKRFDDQWVVVHDEYA